MFALAEKFSYISHSLVNVTDDDAVLFVLSLFLLKSDINLWSTTLRFARTNEVSTINNSAIAASRIVNCNRSPNAIVQFVFITNIATLDGRVLDDFRAALENYVKEHPRTWEAVAFVREEEFDADWEKIYVRLAFRHRNSWQDAARILQNKGQLHRFVFELGKKMGINFRTPPLGRVLYHGGDYVQPVIQSLGGKQE